MNSYDIDTQTMIEVATKLDPGGPVKAELDRSIADRKEAIRSSVRHELTRKLKAIPFAHVPLRARQHFEQTYSSERGVFTIAWTDQVVIEQYSMKAGVWMPITFWPTDEFGALADIEVVTRKLDVLNMHTTGDTERDATEVLEQIRADSQKVREANAKQSDENTGKALELVQDPLGFARATQALSTGETIIAHGDDAKKLDHMQEGHRKALHQLENK